MEGAGWKRPSGASQTSAAFDSENSPPNLGDACVNVMGSPAYTHSFSVHRVPFLATGMVRKWREDHGGKVAKVGQILLFT